jgi:group II intron reverse transcriptase/maturase
MTQCVNWVLDADIRRFFDSVDHEWMLRMLAHRIADRRLLRLIRKWLRAGVLESDEWMKTEQGTPQGAAISPLLANIFLHYTLDLWAHRWRKRHARGRVVIVRYCDDFVMGFQFEADARRMLVELGKRLEHFGLTLHGDKTRLIEFGRLPALRRARSGERRPRSFAFLGFTHYCGWTHDGRFVLKRKTQAQRMTRKLRELRRDTRRCMHAPVAVQHRWLCRVLRGHYGYFGLASNYRPMRGFYWEVIVLWYRSLRRRSQRALSRKRFFELLQRFPLPAPRITRPRDALIVGLG